MWGIVEVRDLDLGRDSRFDRAMLGFVLRSSWKIDTMSFVNGVTVRSRTSRPRFRVARRCVEQAKSRCDVSLSAGARCARAVAIRAVAHRSIPSRAVSVRTSRADEIDDPMQFNAHPFMERVSDVLTK
jgi:hypothetical protein